MAKYPIAVDGVMSRVWEVGHSNRPVVLVHDLSLRADWWRSNLKPLGSAGLRAISFDLPGHGFADKNPAGDHSLEAYAVFVTNLCRQLGLVRPILVGGGIGAHVVAMAAGSGLEVAGLVLASPTGAVAIGADLRAGMAEALFDTSRQGAATRIDALVADTATMNHDWHEEEYEVCASHGQAGVFDRLRPIVADDLDAMLAPGLGALTSSTPTLVLWGDQDRLTPVSLMPSVLQVLDKGVKHRVIEGAGHAPQFDRPDDYNAALVAFAQELG